MAENSYSGMTPVNDILDRTFLFVTDEKAAFVFRLFFSAFAVVFCRKDILRPWVIFEAAALLWRGLIQTEYMQGFQRSAKEFKLTQVTQIADLMCIMGLFDETYVEMPNRTTKQRYLRIHHVSLHKHLLPFPFSTTSSQRSSNNK